MIPRKMGMASFGMTAKTNLDLAFHLMEGHTRNSENMSLLVKDNIIRERAQERGREKKRFFLSAK